MKIFINDQEFDSDYVPIVIKFNNHNDLINVANVLQNTPDPNKHFIAYPSDFDKSEITILKEKILSK